MKARPNFSIALKIFFFSSALGLLVLMCPPQKWGIDFWNFFYWEKVLHQCEEKTRDLDDETQQAALMIQMRQEAIEDLIQHRLTIESVHPVFDSMCRTYPKLDTILETIYPSVSRDERVGHQIMNFVHARLETDKKQENRDLESRLQEDLERYLKSLPTH